MRDLPAVPWNANCGSRCLNWLEMVEAAIDRCDKQWLVFTRLLRLSYRDAPGCAYGIGKTNPKFLSGNFEVGK